MKLSQFSRESVSLVSKPYCFKMLMDYFLVITCFCIFSPRSVLSVEPSLNELLTLTTNFFEKLKLEYETQAASPILYSSIDDQVDEYLRNLKKSTNFLRTKRQLDLNKEIGILNGFEILPGLELSNALDLSFFIHHNGPETHWFVAVLDSSGITLLRNKDQSFIQVAFYELENGTRILTNGYESATLLVIQRSVGDSLVFRLSQENKQQTLRNVQTLDTPDAIHSTLWRGMKQIYLAVSSSKSITIFKWLGEHFDRIQTENFGATRLVPFQTGGWMHLIATDEARTSILKFILRTNEFDVVQKLVAAKDAAAFYLENGHLSEHFVALAGKNSTVIYKQYKHRFVPFQELPWADEIRTITNDNKVILIILITKGDLKIYLYDGWKFIESDIRNPGFVDVVPISLRGEELLAVKMNYTKEENYFGKEQTNNFEEEQAGNDLSQNVENFGANDYSNLEDNEVLRVAGTFWSLRRITWRRRKTWKNLEEETKIWCQDSLQKTLRLPPVLPESAETVRIQNGRVESLQVQYINGESTEKFVKLTQRWNQILTVTSEQEQTVRNYISTINPIFNNLHVGTVVVNGSTQCNAANTEYQVLGEVEKQIRRFDNAKQDLDFRKVKVSSAKNLPCPVPAPKFKKVAVTDLVNGISFPAFLKDVMTTTGNQELYGLHNFTELRVLNAEIPLDVASAHTKQNIKAETVEVDELNITSSGLLLPLNGGPTVLRGSLTIPKIIIKGLIHLQAGITGKGVKAASPMIHISEPLEIYGNISLRNVKIVEKLETNDITRSEGKSLIELISNAVPLNSRNLTGHYKFQTDKVSWNNMSLRNFSFKWVRKNPSDKVIITGKKYIMTPDLKLGDLAYDNLPTPRVSLRLCSVAVHTEGIWESNLVIDQGLAKSVKSINVSENSKFSEIFLDSATSVDEVPWELKNISGRIRVKEMNVGKIIGIDYKGLKNCMERWIEPGRLKGPIKVQNLKVNNLITTVGFSVPLPLEVGNVQSKTNIYIGTINNIDLGKLLDNIVQEQDAISLTNVTFAGGLAVKEINVSQISFSLQQNLSLGYLGSKEILGTFESEAIIVPHILQFPSDDTPVNIIVNGNVAFITEPKIENINEQNVENLYNEIWFTDRPSTISSQFLYLQNVTFANDLSLMNSLDTPNLGSWSDIQNRLFSKTNFQKINVDASFNTIVAPNVIGAAKSRLKSNDSAIHDLEMNALKKNDTNVVHNNWNFDELIVTGNIDFRERINGLNFGKDVVRYDVERNIVSGKKTVIDLTARNINGLKFDEFAGKSLKKKNGEEIIVIEGKKELRTIEMQDIRVNGTIMGRTIENALLKSSTQTLRGPKKFQGSLSSPSIIMNGLINSINLANFVENQLKKHAPSQIIESSLMLSNNLKILGNMTINGLYQGIELINYKSTEEIFASVEEKLSELIKFSEGIDVALENRAIYWDQLEPLENNSMPLITHSEKNLAINFDGLGYCEIEKSFLYCNDEKFFDPLSIAYNGSRILQAQLVTLSKIQFFAFVSSDPGGGIHIYRFNPAQQLFYPQAVLHIPGIIEGSIAATKDTLWISLGLRDHIMILRYDILTNFQEWIIPGSGPFLMSSAPTKELLIFRYDGVWRLGGLAGPRYVFPITLHGRIDTFSFGPDYYVRLTDNNVTTLLKSRFIGN